MTTAARLVAAALALGLGGCGSAGGTSQTLNPTSTPGTSASSGATAVITPAGGSPAPVGGPDDWLAYHRTGARTGVGPAQPAVSASGAHVAWTSPQLDGDILAEPLVDSGRAVVATEGGTLYGFDAASGRQLWMRHVTDPATEGLPCGNINPLGITGTPAIDPASHTVYAVAEKSDGEHLLAAVDDRSGDVLWQRAVDPPGSDAVAQQQRAALAVAGNHVYVALGGLYGDCGDYRGWVVGVGLDGGGDLLFYRVPSSPSGAGIWGASGIAVGDDGSLYVATGNSPSRTAYDHSEATIRLDPTLHEIGFTAPVDWADLNGKDADVGSTGPMLLGGGLVVVGGKDGRLHVSSVDHLGGVGGEVASARLGDAIFGGMALLGTRVFAPCDDGLRAADVGPSGTTSVAWKGPPLRPPIVAYGAVWAMDLAGTQTLHALDPSTGAEIATVAVGATRTFMSPSAGAGLLFVGAYDRLVAVAPR